MKKIITIISVITLLLLPIKAYASNENVVVEVKILGETTKGSNIKINIDVRNVEGLYALSADYTYDPSQIEVVSIIGGDFIRGDKENQMQIPAETNKDGNRAKYGITLLGDVEGRSGSGNIVSIEGKMLKDGDLKISKSNLKVDLVERNKDRKIVPITYVLKGIGSNGENVGSGTESGSSNNGEAPGNNSSNNEQDSSNSGNSSNNNVGTSNEGISDSDDLEEGQNSNTIGGNGDSSSEVGDEKQDNDEVVGESKDKTNDSELNQESEESKGNNNSTGVIDNSVYLVLGILVIIGSGLGIYYKKYKNK